MDHQGKVDSRLGGLTRVCPAGLERGKGGEQASWYEKGESPKRGVEGDQGLAHRRWNQLDLKGQGGPK